MIVLDTNVLSVLMLEPADPVVQDWLNGQERLTVWTSAVTVYEIRLGLELFSAGKRRRQREAAFDRLLTGVLNRRVLPLDGRAAEQAGEWEARRRLTGFNVEIRDSEIAG